MRTRFYKIEILVDGKGEWQEYDGREYTQKEANEMLRMLYVCNLYLTQHKFRKTFLRTATTQILYAR